MDLGTVMSVAQTLFAALQCKGLKEACSFLGYKSQLAELQRTVGVIQAVLRDAETKEELSHQAHLWIQELKDAVYDADDLLDEFITMAKQEQLINGGKASKKVRLFLSRHNPFGVAYKMSQGIKKIRKKLDAIAKDHADFGFNVDSHPIRRRRMETCSYVYENNIIGREDDVQKILGHMFEDSDVKQDVSVLAIVGIGGLGKTALAQLLYNHARVSTAFPLKLWTCVSDCDQEELDVLLILRKILAAATGQNHEGSTKDFLQIQLRERLTSNKYLLVLDDVWTESRIQWQELEDFLLGGQRGSWIMVTTRSHKTARIVKSGLTHELQGLSEENSRHLFKSIAFGSEHSNSQDDLVKIGEEIVEGCARVPLAIKVAGSLLYGQKDKNKWLSFKKIGLSKHRESQKNIFSILEFSYHQLESPLKSCFTYCALFSKDVVIRKDMLLSLWMANEFIVPLDDGQKIEDAAEEYFSILLRRCFFQEIELGSYGEIVSCKIHDLMHDVAQKVARREICISNLVNDDVLKESRHFAYIGHGILSSSNLNNTYMRSYLCSEPQTMWVIKMEQACLEAILANWIRLRVLDLGYSGVESLPESIGELLHLRYLDLSENYGLKVLPKSISKLYNLQTLNLRHCFHFEALPKDIKKLVNLSTLNISRCRRLSNMPESMSKLTCLHVLTMFVIDGSNLSQKQWCNQLGELGKLDSLQGELEVKIKVGEKSIDVMEDGRREAAYLFGKQHLNELEITFLKSDYEEGTVRLLEELQPHPNLKSLKLYGYSDPMMRMPGWANSLGTSLHNLIKLRVEDSNVGYLSCLANLLHLKELHLCRMENLEYIYEDRAVASSNTTSMPHGLPSAQGFLLFPCLETLKLWSLPKLKGWRHSRVGVEDNTQLQHQDIGNMTHLSLPQLKSLEIGNCPELICVLLCPILKELHLRKFNRMMQVVTLGSTIDDEKKEASSPSSSSYDICKLRNIDIDDAMDGSNLSRKKWCNQLGEVGILDRLQGELQVRIKVGEHSIDAMEDGRREAAYLMGKQHLNRLVISCLESDEEGAVRIVEGLQPQPNLNDPMMIMPGWANNLATALPNLTSLGVEVSDLEYLSCLGNLPHLKVLQLKEMNKLEYIYEDRAVACSNETPSCMPHGLVSFPCIETLHLWELPKLKGWGNSRAGVKDNTQQQDNGNTAHLSLPQLKSLEIRNCPELICILVCPNLQELLLRKFNRKMQVVTLGNTIHDDIKEASSPSLSSYDICKLRKIDIDDVSWLNSFPREAFRCLIDFHVEGSEVESLREAEEVFHGCSSSLQQLEISFCPNLKRVWSGGLEHLIALQNLHIRGCLLAEEESEDDISMSRLPCLNSLRTLLLSSHQQLVYLKNWIHFLVALQSLTIYNCEGLESLPNWMPKLTSLRELHLWYCSAHLKERCKHTTGQDCPYIQHFPTIQFYP